MTLSGLSRAGPIASAGNETVDEVVRRFVEAYGDVFPGQGVSYYLIGSWIDGMTNHLSDIDLIVVRHSGDPSDADRQSAERICRSLQSPIRLDVAVLTERDLPGSHIGVNLKLDSLLLAGEDVRDRLPLPSMEDYIESTCEAAQYFMARVLRGRDTVTLPIGYPEPDGDFYGYDRKRIDEWYPPSVHRGLKEVVSTGTHIARALVAVQGQRYVGSKTSAITVYGEIIGDEWATYLETLYRKGKMEWAYLISQDEGERRILKALCAQFLFLERHFLETVEYERMQ
ncbi:MAG: hypothetical protein NVS4B2_28970 [Chloroflexota bacterium]